MGVLNLFSKDGREQRARGKNIKAAVNKYAQAPDRMRALQALRDDGSPEALYGLLRRFGMMYDKSIEDEQEKEWVFEVLVGEGRSRSWPRSRVPPPAESISWPLRLLDKIVATKDEQIDVIEEVLARHEPGYERDPTKKIQLLNHLGGAQARARVAGLAAPLPGGHGRGGPLRGGRGALRQGDEAAARSPLLDHFVSDKEDSLRIRIRIAEGFAEHGWSGRRDSPRRSRRRRLPDAFQHRPPRFAQGRRRTPAIKKKREDRSEQPIPCPDATTSRPSC